MNFNRWLNQKDYYVVGLVGYSSTDFDETKARKIIQGVFQMLVDIYPDRKYALASRINKYWNS